jgi:hypothetical protein
LPVTLPPNPAVKADQVRAIQEFFDQVRAVRSRAGLSVQQQITEIGALPGAEGISVSARSGLLALDNRGFDDLETRAVEAIQMIMDSGVPEQLLPPGSNTPTNDVGPIVVNEYLETSGNSPASAPDRAVLSEVLLGFIVPNMAVDTVAT